MRSAPRKPQPTQAETLRRGIEMARLLATRPHRVEELAAALGMQRLAAERLLAQLRGAGLEIETEARGRERYHSLRVIPTWLARAVKALGPVHSG